MARDLRKYARQTNVRLGIGMGILLFVVGIALIYVIYGKSAAVAGMVCLVGALVPIGLIAFALWVLDWIQKRANRS